ncbi:MAG TPA: HAMP domain-containing sensor histidine kinase [Chloroflexota bacterium]|nr:HAMP domain-containing sensor histidine kinase [Chloroflexota bacterium]
MPLRLRLSITYALVFALAIAVLGALLYLTMREILSVEMDRRLVVRGNEVQLALWPGPQHPTLNDLQPGRIDMSPLKDIDAAAVSVQVLSLSGTLLGSSDTLAGVSLPPDRAEFAEAVAGRDALFDLTLPSGRPARVLDMPVLVGGRPAAVLRVLQSRQVLRDTMAGLRQLLIVLGLAGVAVAGVVGLFVANQGLRPLSAISEQAAKVAADRDFSRRLSLKRVRRDEVGQLAGTIDNLLATVEDTLRAHREFLADTSHDLRNPLLAIRTNLELLGRVRDPAARDECIQEATQQVERMSRLVSDLLLLAQVETRLIVQWQTVDLAEVARQAVQHAQARATGQELVLQCAPSVEVQGDKGRIGQILANLLDNALQHTAAGGRIVVRVEDGEQEACLSVEDNGRGIDPADLPRIFERGFRGAGSNGSGSGAGYGLGLAIVKHLVEAHGGSVEAHSEPERGTCIRVRFPKHEGGRGGEYPVAAFAS